MKHNSIFHLPVFFCDRSLKHESHLWFSCKEIQLTYILCFFFKKKRRFQNPRMHLVSCFFVELTSDRTNGEDKVDGSLQVNKIYSTYCKCVKGHNTTTLNWRKYNVHTCHNIVDMAKYTSVMGNNVFYVIFLWTNVLSGHTHLYWLYWILCFSWQFTLERRN